MPATSPLLYITGIHLYVLNSSSVTRFGYLSGDPGAVRRNWGHVHHRALGGNRSCTSRSHTAARPWLWRRDNWLR